MVNDDLWTHWLPLAVGLAVTLDGLRNGPVARIVERVARRLFGDPPDH